MTITARFFASFQDIVGSNRLKLPVDDASTVIDVIKQLEQQYPQFEGRLEKFSLVAINEEYTHRQQLLTDGDVIAFFPPVSGG